MRSWFAISWLLLLSSTALGTDRIDYDQQIRPLLQHKCVACHGALKQSAGLRLDAGQLILQGGSDGQVVIAGDSDASIVMERVASTDASLRMPPAGEGEQLTADQRAILKKWIDQGAVFPEDEQIPEDPVHYWSYRPIERPEVPVVMAADRVRTAVDAFVLAELDRHGLELQPDASRATWLRRVHLDLTGIPPTRSELHAFLADESPDAFEHIVDGLLERTEYGERWGRHWMDVWRYSDWYGSRGGDEIRYSQRHIWRWRDWIIESLNADRSYAQMVKEMLAGDELAPADPDVLRATGFLGRNWYKFDRNVWMYETVEQTSQAFLGLTMRCARCHDHKFDPIAQEDYYRFRAFFEPHDVRTDPISVRLPAATGIDPELSSGVARVFDRQVDAPTYLFQRGDDRFPDTSFVLTPAVPPALGGPELSIQPVHLQPQAYYPGLRPAVAESLKAAAEANVVEITEQLNQFQQELRQAEAAVEEIETGIVAGRRQQEPEPVVVLTDTFTEPSDLWEIVSGSWSWQEGGLRETSVGNFATIVASVQHPRDFSARVRYRTLQPGSYRSVGFSFDYIDQGNSQDVYTATGDASQTVQAFHRQGGRQHYPQAGIVSTQLSVGEITTVEITVRDRQLRIVLNEQPKLDYVLPIERRDGRFALWVHQGSAEFLEVHVEALQPSLDDLRQVHQAKEDQVELHELRLKAVTHAAAAVRARIHAEQLKYGVIDAAAADFSDQQSAAELRRQTFREAMLAERRHAVAVAEVTVLEAAQQLKAGNRSGVAAAEIAVAEKKLDAAQSVLAKATDALTEAIEHADAEPSWTGLGDVYPQVSSGRRKALAEWIAHAENPRTARVAVNQIWLRHFGEALVPSVANFGLNGQRPSHPELLDWLAAELTAQEWRMKPIHRMLVLSTIYRQRSAGQRPEIDPQNRLLWRMNGRRMEAEVVRDSLLALTGTLDRTRGGPEIVESEIQRVFRRSLYFRNTPNEKAAFLESFDMANPNECYRRQESVMPKQALALMNSGLAIDQARLLAEQLSESIGGPMSESIGGPNADNSGEAFIIAAFETILSRSPTGEEISVCQKFLRRNSETSPVADERRFANVGQTAARAPSADQAQRARENLVHTLFSHNDFVTIR